MAEYRYLVFPLGMQPTEDEAAQLKGAADALSHRFAIGRERGNGALVVAFDVEAFDRAMQSRIGFAALVQLWQRRGCHVVEHLKFVKDSAALQPVTVVSPVTAVGPVIGDPVAPSRRPSYARILASKELAAKEAVGRNMLRVQQTLERHEALVRLGYWMPYLLMAAAAVGTIATGFYTGMRLLASDTEPRKATTERIIEDPMQRSLTRPAAATEESEQ